MGEKLYLIAILVYWVGQLHFVTYTTNIIIHFSSLDDCSKMTSQTFDFKFCYLSLFLEMLKTANDQIILDFHCSEAINDVLCTTLKLTVSLPL